MVDRSVIGKESPPTRITLRAEAMREFAAAIGETNPVHLDAAAARTAGFADVVATPTYPIAFMAEAMDPDLFFELGLNIPSIVHGEQEFIYHRPVVAGEELTVRGRIADVWEKTGQSGVLDFVVLEAQAEDAQNKPVYVSRITLISKRALQEDEGAS
jgi:acyl dehydratase